MLARSLAFLRHAWDPERLGMHNFLSYDRRWLDEPYDGDHLGRAAWALGEVVGADPPTAVLEPSRILLLEMVPVLARQRSPRTMAFSILGLAHGDPERLGEEATEVLRDLAGRLADQQRANATHDWYWAEDQLAYDNARLPQALIAAGSRLRDDELLGEGLRALDWYSGEVGVDAPFTRHVGHHNRQKGTAHPGSGDEQPLNAAALTEAQTEAFRATRSEVAARRAVRAFEWFLGRNRLDTAVYDFATGGCHDGLGEAAVNVNEGAEATLAYLQALLVLDAARAQGDAARMRVALLGPIAWRTPPRHYGPWELITGLLADGLADREIDVTLFATLDSVTRAKLDGVCPRPYEEDPDHGRPRVGSHPRGSCARPLGRLRSHPQPSRLVAAGLLGAHPDPRWSPRFTASRPRASCPPTGGRRAHSFRSRTPTAPPTSTTSQRSIMGSIPARFRFPRREARGSSALGASTPTREPTRRSPSRGGPSGRS